jgi:DMSO/TMAO reductase YedYZ molybdopterin-dependent catalytic subunit
MPLINRGFRRRQAEPSSGARLPPGQHLVGDFPVLSAGPTPRIALEDWELSIEGAVANPRRLSWEEFVALPGESIRRDIHCVTSWSKLETGWEGVSLDTLLESVEPRGAFTVIHSYGGYTTNLALDDLTGGKAWVAHAYEGMPLAPQHGGPARLLVPHLYFWKSAKWIRRIVVTEQNEPGFWETLGYHDRGDPWREQRYQGD